MEDIHAQIQDLKIQLESIERADRYLQELKRQLKTEHAKIGELRKAMAKEHQDVLKLENWSLKDVFIKVTNKEEQLEKEKEEYLQAAIAVQEAEKQAEMIEFELSILQEKISKRNEIETKLEALYEAQEIKILRSDPNHPLKMVLHKIARWQQLDRELEEAILRGTNVAVILEEIVNHLERAKKWVSNILRDHGYRMRMLTEEIDQARIRLPKLRMEFIKFEEEINEVFQFPELEAWDHDQQDGLRKLKRLINDLSNFTRSFLRGLIRDWILQQQLHKSHTLTNQLKHQAETNIKWLRLEQDKVKQEISRLENERRHMLR